MTKGILVVIHFFNIPLLITFNTTVWHVDKNIQRDTIKHAPVRYVVQIYIELLIFYKTFDSFMFKQYKN